MQEHSKRMKPQEATGLSLTIATSRVSTVRQLFNFGSITTLPRHLRINFTPEAQPAIFKSTVKRDRDDH